MGWRGRQDFLMGGRAVWMLRSEELSRILTVGG
jgi:hypothetical protein